jgi:hypothetical protein
VYCNKCGDLIDDVSDHDCSATVAQKRTKTVDNPADLQKVAVSGTRKSARKPVPSLKAIRSKLSEEDHLELGRQRTLLHSVGIVEEQDFDLDLGKKPKMFFYNLKIKFQPLLKKMELTLFLPGDQKPNSLTYNFVEVSGHNLESSQV